jgi:hypothetical protein
MVFFLEFPNFVFAITPFLNLWRDGHDLLLVIYKYVILKVSAIILLFYNTQKEEYLHFLFQIVF